MEFSDTFEAMGTRVDVVLEAPRLPAAALAAVRVLFERREAALSRFRPASTLSRLNSGEVVRDRTLAAACNLAITAHRFTGGLFNPMILPSLAAAGYDRTFDSISGGQPVALPVPDPNEALRIDGDTVQLLQGALDLGGIVKGWTVDLAVELLAEDFTGILVNAGGDLRVAGSEPGREGWLVGVDGIDGELAWEGELTGALATSTVLKRSWRVADGRVAHHLIDPRTGLPATTARCQVSVAGPVTWEAECWTKAILIGGSPVARQAGKAGYRVISARDCPGSSVEQRTLLGSGQ